jgi:hypothetical protein
VLAANAHCSPTELINAIIQAQTRFVDGAPNLDDATLVAIRRTAGKPAIPRNLLATDETPSSGTHS